MKNRTSRGRTQKNTKPQTVEAYLAALPKDVRAALETLRKIIKTAAPKATEVISYKIPTFKHNGMLVSFAAFQNHCSFFVGKLISTKFKEELKVYDASGATIRFPADKPLPAALLKKLVKARMKENESRMKHEQD